MEQAVAAGTTPGEVWFALELEHLHPTVNSKPRRSLAFVVAMDGHDDARFVLQMLAHGEIGDMPTAEHEAHWYRHNPTSRQAVTT